MEKKLLFIPLARFLSKLFFRIHFVLKKCNRIFPLLCYLLFLLNSKMWVKKDSVIALDVSSTKLLGDRTISAK